MALSVNIAVLGFRRLAAGGLISSSSEAAGYAAQNLGNDALWTTTWRSVAGAVTSVDVTFNLGSPQPVQALFLVGTNFTATATRQTWIGNDPTFATNLDTSPLQAAFDASLAPLLDDTPPWGRTLIYLAPNQVTAQYGRLRVTDASNPDGYLRGAIGGMEDIWQPARNMAFGWSRPDTIAGQDGAQILLRGQTIPFPALTEAEERKVRSLGRALKGQGRVLVIPSPSKPSTWPAEAIWATFTDLGEAVAVDKKGRFRQLTLKFQEVAE